MVGLLQLQEPCPPLFCLLSPLLPPLFSHTELHEELDGKENMVEFDFLGKDSIRYYNRVQVERQVFKNVGIFMRDKIEGDDLFDRLTVGVCLSVLEWTMK